MKHKLNRALCIVVMDSRSAYSNESIRMETGETDEAFAERVKQDILKKLSRFR